MSNYVIRKLKETAANVYVDGRKEGQTARRMIAHDRQAGRKEARMKRLYLNVSIFTYGTVQKKDDISPPGLSYKRFKQHTLKNACLPSRANPAHFSVSKY